MTRIPRHTFFIIAITGITVFLGNLLANWETSRPSGNPIEVINTGISAGLLKRDLSSLPEPNIALAKRTDTPPRVYARSYVVIESDTNYPLAQKDADKQVPIASTTKIMTAIQAIETLPLDKVVTVSSRAATIEGSEIQLLTGEKITIKSLLYALMLNSANDAAQALSEAEGDSAIFVESMNDKAKLLGLRNTHYADPAGLKTESQSSPRDLAILMDYALTNPIFRSLIQTPTYTIWSADNRYKHDLKSSNRLIHQDESFYLPQALGGKTGFTYEAGHCLVAAAESDGKRYIAAVLFTTEDTIVASAKEARKLLAWAMNKY